MTGPTERSSPTLLKALVRERRLTVEEAVAALGRRAAKMGETGFSLSGRQLRRWLKGDVASVDSLRAANVRVIEAEFGWPMAALLDPDRRSVGQRIPRPPPGDDRPLRTEEFVAWVAEHSALSYEAAHSAVASGAASVAGTSPITRANRHHARSRIGRSQLVDALSVYYETSESFYTARVDRSLVELSILTSPAWVGLAVPLGGAAETCALVSGAGGPGLRLNDQQTGSAVARLAEIEAGETMMVNNPLYRLAALDISADHLAAEFSRVDFAAYALTADLLEGELLAQVAEMPGQRSPRLALRDAWLPCLQDGPAFDRRVCVGGPACLVAVAEGDQYHLLVQERSAQVLNVTGALAVIPKAFHQPTVDAYGETRVSTTVERELEEELLGRPDLEQLSAASSRSAAPLHPLNASAPMAWLHAHPDAWRMECTGFGINMVSGNYEFACLVAVHDPTWWRLYGHMLEANWEAMRLHRYSSLDHAGLVELISDPRWSNEGLFAFIEGLRRLAGLDPARVRVPVTLQAA